MSYEGFIELLCENGHHSSIDDDGHQMWERRCTACSHLNKWVCRVDLTNGFDEKNPRTFAGPKSLILTEDVPKVDHYGNKYFGKRDRWAPDLSSGRWESVSKYE